jgi:hypothetical protein
VGEADRLIAELRGGGARGDPGDGSRLQVEGIGWATVELDRAAGELAGGLGLPDGTSFEAAASDRLLGAFARRVRVDAGPWIVLLEPSTEGRLAAFLVRHDEGVAVVYLRASRARPRDGPPTPVPGPLGPQRLLAGDRSGPWLIVVDAAAG